MNDESRDNRALEVPASRLSRISRLGGMTAGVAGNMALGGMGALGRGQRPVWRDLLLTPQNVTRIADRLSEMRGAAMKIGQLISMDTGDVLPPELAQIMARLRDDAHFMPPAQLKQVLNHEWCDGWIKAFRNFNVRPIAAASIGQVHRCELKDGRTLAIKVQYPGVARSIDSDVANVATLIRMSGLLPKGFELDPYLDDAKAQLHEETDYALEGRHMQTFGELLAGDDRFSLPELAEDWTTSNILAMSFLEGDPIETARDLSQTARDGIATALVDLLLQELFSFGLMQTDPNFANYRYNRESGRIVLLDFGATRVLNDRIIDQYRSLMQAGLDQDRVAMQAVCLDIGFFNNNTDPRHVEQILNMMSLVFSTVSDADVFDFAATDLPRKMQAEGIALAEAGFVPPPLPIDVLFLQRKFGGVFLLASQLGARVPVRAMLEKHLT